MEVKTEEVAEHESNEVSLFCFHNLIKLLFLCIDDGIFLISLTTKKFGVTEFVNPKYHDKPAQDVSSTRTS